MSDHPTAESLIWFRRDLRVNDNAALHHATQDKPNGVIGVFFVTPGQWQQHDDADHKISFMMASLEELSNSLSKLNIPLLIKTCDSFDDVPGLLQKTCRQHQVQHVFFNREYEANEEARDQEAFESLTEAGISVQRFHDRVIVPPLEIKTKQEAFYSVFTPYRKVWDRTVAEFEQTFGRPKKQKPTSIQPSAIPKKVKGFSETEVWQHQFPAGEAAAAKKLKAFAKHISAYNDHRDLPSVDGTSSLSAYLAAGVVSPRQCLAMARDVQANSSGENDGARVWISELTWRDFYAHVMVGYPRVSKNLPFKLKTNRLDWRTDRQDFEAWCAGKTGFPIVDAGMRQLNQTGWMHNRLRMVTAMFLTKNLLIDWRLGERYFMQNLIDGDLAANNGGWQWSASTGTDAVPYFRIFSPFSQSKRFDSDGEFIKRLCPELKSVPAAALHDPKKLTAEIERRNIDYPHFVVDYRMSRERALAAFKAL